MLTFKELKRTLKKDTSGMPTIKVSLLGDSATQFLATAIKGVGIERGYNIDLFEAEYNQVERQVLDPTSDLYAHIAENGNGGGQFKTLHHHLPINPQVDGEVCLDVRR